MKQIFSLLAVSVLLSSCESGWSDEDKKMYHQSCYEGAMTWAGTEANAKAYCDCMQEKLMAKYPDINELIEHVHEIGTDPELQQCKQVIKK